MIYIESDMYTFSIILVLEGDMPFHGFMLQLSFLIMEQISTRFGLFDYMVCRFN